MPTNEERREVARNLRNAYPGRFNSLTYGIHLGDVGIAACAQIVSAHRGITMDAAQRLADLIEPEPERTCLPVLMDREGNHRDDIWVIPLDELTFGCSECGHPWGTLSTDAVNYCEDCGAKVVRNEAD